jgi:NAD+ kinase
MICTDPRNPRAAQLFADISTRVDLEALDPSVALVIGGDGWMLQCMREFGPGRVYLGVNAGHLGFLLNDPSNLEALCAELRAGAYTVYDFPRLHLQATTADGTVIEADAVNDIYLERASGQTAHLTVTVDGQLAVRQLVCDGVIVATALGSTAYSYSAGGVPCHPRVPGMHVTPIAPHAPRLSPMLLPLDSVVEVQAMSPARRPVRAVCDGVDSGRVTRMRVVRSADDVRLAFLGEHAFTGTLIRKVLKA